MRIAVHSVSVTVPGKWSWTSLDTLQSSWPARPSYRWYWLAVMWMQCLISPTDCQCSGEEVVLQWRSTSFPQSERTWKDFVRLAWQMSPHLAVHMTDRYIRSTEALDTKVYLCSWGFGVVPVRFPNVEAVKKEVTAIVSVRPGPVSDTVEALRFIVTEQNIKGDVPAVSRRFAVGCIPVLCSKLIHNAISPTSQIGLMFHFYPHMKLVWYHRTRILVVRSGLLLCIFLSKTAETELTPTKHEMVHHVSNFNVANSCDYVGSHK